MRCKFKLCTWCKCQGTMCSKCSLAICFPYLLVYTCDAFRAFVPCLSMNRTSIFKFTNPRMIQPNQINNILLHFIDSKPQTLTPFVDPADLDKLSPTYDLSSQASVWAFLVLALSACDTSGMPTALSLEQRQLGLISVCLMFFYPTLFPWICSQHLGAWRYAE